MTKNEFVKHAYGLVEKAIELRQVAWKEGKMNEYWDLEYLEIEMNKNLNKVIAILGLEPEEEEEEEKD